MAAGRQPPAEADNERGLRAPEPSLASPQQVWPSQQSSPCFPRLLSCCALGIKAAFVPGRQMAVLGAEAHLAVGPGRHQPRSLLMRNAQDIHGRGHRSKWLALNYIFSDCKLLLTASRPALQLTFLTKGHLLTCSPCFLRLLGASSSKGRHRSRTGPCHPGSWARPLPGMRGAVNGSLIEGPEGEQGSRCLRPSLTCQAGGDWVKYKRPSHSNSGSP